MAWCETKETSASPRRGRPRTDSPFSRLFASGPVFSYSALSCGLCISRRNWLRALEPHLVCMIWGWVALATILATHLLPPRLLFVKTLFLFPSSLRNLQSRAELAPLRLTGPIFVRPDWLRPCPSKSPIPEKHFLDPRFVPVSVICLVLFPLLFLGVRLFRLLFSAFVWYPGVAFIFYANNVPGVPLHCSFRDNVLLQEVSLVAWACPRYDFSVFTYL